VLKRREFHKYVEEFRGRLVNIVVGAYSWQQIFVTRITINFVDHHCRDSRSNTKYNTQNYGSVDVVHRTKF
jgi:hypothetical protein